MTQVATCSTVVRVWSLDSGAPAVSSQFNHHTAPINDLRWNHNSATSDEAAPLTRMIC